MKNINELYGKLAEAGRLLLAAYEQFCLLDEALKEKNSPSELSYEIQQLEYLTLGDARRRSLVEAYLKKLDLLNDRGQKNIK